MNITILSSTPITGNKKLVSVDLSTKVSIILAIDHLNSTQKNTIGWSKHVQCITKR